MGSGTAPPLLFSSSLPPPLCKFIPWFVYVATEMGDVVMPPAIGSCVPPLFSISFSCFLWAMVMNAMTENTANDLSLVSWNASVSLLCHHMSTWGPCGLPLGKFLLLHHTCRLAAYPVRHAVVSGIEPVQKKSAKERNHTHRRSNKNETNITGVSLDKGSRAGQGFAFSEYICHPTPPELRPNRT